MENKNETKIALTAEEIEENRETEFGLSGLFRGVGDAARACTLQRGHAHAGIHGCYGTR